MAVPNVRMPLGHGLTRGWESGRTHRHQFSVLLFISFVLDITIAAIYTNQYSSGAYKFGLSYVRTRRHAGGQLGNVAETLTRPKAGPSVREP